MSSSITNSGDVSVNINQIATDLNNKVDRDLINLSNTGKINASGLVLSGNKIKHYTLGASGGTYVTPANGWWYLSKYPEGDDHVVYLQVGGHYAVGGFKSIAGSVYALYAPARKGDIITVTYNTGSAINQYFFFTYAQGSESEAS